MKGYSLQEIRRGTGWPKGARFALIVEPEPSTWRQTACRFCGQDIEGEIGAPRGEWRDRGNNTLCPGNSQSQHFPVGD